MRPSSYRSHGHGIHLNRGIPGRPGRLPGRTPRSLLHLIRSAVPFIAVTVLIVLVIRVSLPTGTSATTSTSGDTEHAHAHSSDVQHGQIEMMEDLDTSITRSDEAPLEEAQQAQSTVPSPPPVPTTTTKASPPPPPPPRERPAQFGAERNCHALENTELWGAVVRAGTDVIAHTSQECCAACRRVAVLDDGSPGCDTWVWCGNATTCREMYRQCWLKRADKPMQLEVRARGADTPWTSGTLFAPLPVDADDIRSFLIKGVGVPASDVRVADVSRVQASAVRFTTSLGSFAAILRPDLSPRAAEAFTNATEGRSCDGGACNFYRSEAVPAGWDEKGFYGPPYALFQGTLGRSRGSPSPLPMEAHPVVRRGHLCVIGTGPDFFVALADHPEWGKAHSVVGFVPTEGMRVLDGIVAASPTREDVWGTTHVTPLIHPIPFQVSRVDALETLATFA